LDAETKGSIVTEAQKTETPFQNLSEEIKPHVHTIRALTLAHNLIMESSWTMSKVQDAYQSCAFLRSICQQAMTKALEVPGWEQVNELVQWKAQLESQKKPEEKAPEAVQAPIGDEQPEAPAHV
jgi:hypothetical protein